MTNSVLPTAEQLRALTDKGPEGAIVMVNLLKYREKALYKPDRAEAKEDISGLEAYRRYGVVAFRCVSEAGGGIVWSGRQSLVVIGASQDEWDEVLCVRYPSRAAFLQMIARPDYVAAGYHRVAALERAALLCCAAGTAA